MLSTRLIACLAACLLWPLPAFAQSSDSQPLSQMAPGDVASATTEALHTLGSAAKDKLLVRDLIGAKVTGPSASPLGTVEDLVVIPGGRVVAAIISPNAKDLGRVPVPFSVTKISHYAGKLELTLPVSLSELKGMKEVQSLAQALPGVK